MSDESLILIVDKANQRLDKFLLAHLDGFSRAQAQHLIREGCVLVDGAAQKTGYKLKGGEQITLRVPPRAETFIEPEDILLDIVYEDEHLAVIDKPAGMVVHPGAGNESGTLVHALLARYPELANMMDDPDVGERLGIVHRLDRGTSGLIVAAREQGGSAGADGAVSGAHGGQGLLGAAGEAAGVEYGHGRRAHRPRLSGSANAWRFGEMASRRRRNSKCSTMTSRVTARWCG